MRVIVIGFSSGAAYGGECEIDAEGEWCGSFGKEGFEVMNHGAELCRGVAQTADCAETTG